MGTRLNRLAEAVLTCTHNQCFEQNKEKHHNFSSENYRFYSCEKSQYITFFRNGNSWIPCFECVKEVLGLVGKRFVFCE